MAKSRKKFTAAQIDGDRGAHFVAFITEGMGHAFYPYGSLDPGIDGAIELRDPQTSELSGQHLLVQTKAVKKSFGDETPESFTFRVRRRDLDHWMTANAPVLLVVSRPSTAEAYWISVKDFFADPARREKRLAIFDKREDRYDTGVDAKLRAVLERERDRRAQAVQSMLAGPMSAYGLDKRLQKAQKATHALDHRKAGRRWRKLAARLEGRVDRPFVWPLLERAASALQGADERDQARGIYVRLARERLDHDHPGADFDIQRAISAGASDTDPDLATLWLRASTPELGTDLLDDLRHHSRTVRGTRRKRDAAAALIDALMFFGLSGEALEVANEQRLKKLDSALKRGMCADRLDAAGEIGEDVETDWQLLINAADDAGPWALGTALQRRGQFLCRRGEAVAAQEAYRRAAKVWAGVEGADDQVAECLLSTEAVANLLGQRGEPLPFGSREAALVARGYAQVPAVRAEGLSYTGLAYLADEEYPDALKHLTMAAMVERRAGDLWGWRRTLLFLARGYEKTDELREALRCWVLLGREKSAASCAKRLSFSESRNLLRLDRGTPWERAASFAALAAIADDLDDQEVAEVAAATVVAAKPLPDFVYPQPSHYARQVLCSIASRLPTERVEAAVPILGQEIELTGYSAAPAAQALVALTQRGVIDAIPIIVDALLAGQDLPVTVAGWLREAPEDVQRQMVEAALAGNTVALGECARADLPKRFPELTPLCEEVIRKAVSDESRAEDEAGLGIDYHELGDLGRHVTPQLQKQLAEMIGDTVFAETIDDVSKLSALITTATLAPGLRPGVAKALLDRLLPVAAGEPVESASGELRDHMNPKRARSRFTRRVGDTQLQSAAIQACGRLGQVANPRSRRLANLLDETIADGDPDLVRMAIRELIGLPRLRIRTSLQELAAGMDGELAALAAEALAARETE